MLQSLRSTGSETRASISPLLQIVAVLLLVPIGALTLLSLRWEIFHDATLMYFIGRDIAHGARAVADVFDMNMPLVHWMHAGIYILFGLNPLAWRLLDLAVVAAICAAGYRMVHPIAGPFAIGAVVWILARHNFAGPFIVGQRDVLMLALVLCAALLMIRSAERGGDARANAAAGFMLGIGMMLKPTGVLFPPIMVLAVLVAVPRLRGVKAAVVEFGPLAVGCAIPVALVVGVLATQGTLFAFIEMWTQYLIPAYGKVRFGTYYLFEHVWEIVIPAALVAGIALIWGARLKLDVRVALLAAIATAGLLGLIAQGKGWSYHAVPFNYTLILLTAVLAEQAWRRAAPAQQALTALIVVAAAWPFLILSVKTLGEIAGARSGEDWPPVTTSRMIEDLDNVIDRSRPVQSMDTTFGAIDALLRTGRRQPTRFIYDFQFYIGADTAYRARLREEFLAGLEAAGEHALLVTNQQWPGKFGFDRIDDPNLWPELNRLITTKYKLVAERSADLPHGKQYRIYRTQP